MNTKVLSIFVLLPSLMGLASCESAKPTPQPSPRVESAPVQTAHHWPTRRTTDATMNWAAMAYPTGTASTSVVGIEKGTPKQVNKDQEFEYLLIVTNLTSNELVDVSVTEDYGPYFEVISSTPAADLSRDNTATWAIGSMQARESRTIRVRGKGTTIGTISSCASVSYASLLCMGIPVVAPELQLALTGPAEVLRCDRITYSLNVSNPGSGALTDVNVRHPLPAGLTTADGRNAAEFTVDRLDPGQTRTYDVAVVASRAGTFENKATARGGGLTAESSTVRTVVREPKLEITRSCPDLRYMGRNIEVELTVRNTGNGVANDLIVEDTIPSGATVANVGQGGQVAGNRVVWNLGTLNPEASRTLTVVYRPQNIATYQGTASARAYCADAVNDACTTSVEGIPALLLDGFDDPDPVEIGNTTTYTLVVTNQGSADLTNVRLFGQMDEGDTMTFVSATGSSPEGQFNGTRDGRRINFPAVQRLTPGARATYLITVRAAKPGQVSFRAEAVSNEITRPLVKIETTNFYE